MTRTKHPYKRFFSLFIGQAFFIGRRKLAVKVGFATYQEHAKEARTAEQWGKQTPKKTIAPWRKVRTLIPVTTTGRLVLNHNVQSVPAHWLTGQPTATTGCASQPREMTHYFGDGCPGGHREEPTGEPHHPDNPVGVDSQEHLDKILAEANLRDPMTQDHTTDQVPTHERNGPAS
jgi:hypothetical protein